MAISTAAKKYLRAAFVRNGIPYEQGDNAFALNTGLVLDTGNTPHDTAVVTGPKFGWAGDFSDITGGTFAIIVGAQTTSDLAFDATAATIKTAIIALSNVEPTDVTAGAGTLVGGDLLFTCDAAWPAAPVARLDPTDLLSGTSEIQTVVVDATGGTFTLTFQGQTTAAIAANATGAAVQAALVALSNIATADVDVVRSGAVNSYTYTVTFQGALAYTSVTQMTSAAGSLTGGAGTVVHATTTQGVDGNGPASDGWLTEAETLPYIVAPVIGAVSAVDTILNSIGYPSLGSIESTAWLTTARLTNAALAAESPPVETQTNTKYLKNA
jgi:hypothetical protein